MGRYLDGRRIAVALIVNVALGGPLAFANSPPHVALQPELLPPALQASFQKCDEPLILPADLWGLDNKLHTTGCKVKHRLLAKLSRLPELSRLAFTCPIIVTLDRKNLPTASIGYTTPSRCDLTGQKIEKTLMMALMATRFDPLDPDIGDSAMFSIDLRIATARGAIPSAPSRSAFLRQDGMDLQANSRLITFANRDKLPPFPPPPSPGSGSGGSGAAPAIDTSGFAKAWQLQIGKQAVAAIRNDRNLDQRLRKRPWSVTARFVVGTDQTLQTVDIMVAAGAAEDQIDAIKAALLTIERIEPVPGQPNTLSFAGPVSLALRNP